MAVTMTKTITNYFNMELSTGQNLFIDSALRGENIFLTGKAGTGKSFVVKEIVRRLLSAGRKIVTIAPTGIAANNIGGSTIHSLFSINPFGISTMASSNFLRGEKRRLLNAIEIIVIDEVSMLRPDILDCMNWTLLKNGCDGLHTKQIIFVGDLEQLPPVLNDNARSVLYQTYDGDSFYYAKIYPKLNVIKIELDEVLRQTNEEFINNLNIIRGGGKSDYFKQFVGDDIKGVVLAPHNSTVDQYNHDGLNSLDSEKYVFTASISGNVKADDFNLETVVTVKNGAKIMYLANSKDNPLVNGTLGIFVSHSDCHYIHVDGVDYALKPMKFTKKDYVLNEALNCLELEEKGSIEQYPIRLAYALSIHKSQGLTFNEVTLDLKRPCFLKQQLYVALSRVTAPEGLRIIISNK